MWTQIVGKTRLSLTPLENHWWNVVLYVTPRGLNTSPIPFRKETFEVDFDFEAHKLSIRTSEGNEHGMGLYPRSVADFYSEYMACLRSLGIEVSINPNPVEFDDDTPFDEDWHHESYDAKHVESFRRILINCDRVFKEFRSRFTGKSSPVHFFWGSFDLAVTRFCGRLNPNPPGPSKMMSEAYSEEVNSCGFWPGNGGFGQAAFYSYAYPQPTGFADAAITTAGAYYSREIGEFLLPYDAIREAAAPAEKLLDFLRQTYAAAADLGKWDRAALERPPS